MLTQCSQAYVSADTKLRANAIFFDNHLRPSFFTLPLKRTTKSHLTADVKIDPDFTPINLRLQCICLATNKPAFFSKSYSINLLTSHSVRSRRLVFRAAAVFPSLVQPGSTGSMEYSKWLAIWYICSTIANKYSKKTLRVLPYPHFIVIIQLAIVTICFLLFYCVCYPDFHPLVDTLLLKAVFLPALLHAFNNLVQLANILTPGVWLTSFVRAAEPLILFAIAISLGTQSFSILVLFSLILIWRGAAHGSVGDFSLRFFTLGVTFATTLASIVNAGLLKQAFYKLPQIDVATSYVFVALPLSVAFCLPAIVLDRRNFSSDYSQAMDKVGHRSTFYSWLLLSGLFHSLATYAALQVLRLTDLLTFTVLHAVKPVVEIIIQTVCFLLPTLPETRLSVAVMLLGLIVFFKYHSRPLQFIS